MDLSKICLHWFQLTQVLVLRSWLAPVALRVTKVMTQLYLVHKETRVFRVRLALRVTKVMTQLYLVHKVFKESKALRVTKVMTQ